MVNALCQKTKARRRSNFALLFAVVAVVVFCSIVKEKSEIQNPQIQNNAYLGVCYRLPFKRDATNDNTIPKSTPADIWSADDDDADHLLRLWTRVAAAEKFTLG